jgi:hypothetical protein
MKSKLLNIDLHAWHYHATSAIFFGFFTWHNGTRVFCSVSQGGNSCIVNSFFSEGGTNLRKNAFLLQRGVKEH